MFLVPNVEVLKKKRTEAGLSQYKLAVKAGLPLTAIYRLENGRTQKTNHLRADVIAHALGCDVYDIFERET